MIYILHLYTISFLIKCIIHLAYYGSSSYICLSSQKLKGMKKGNNSIIVASLLIFIGAFSRLIDHLPNFSPMEAIALFGGAYLTSRVAAYLIPIVAIFLSDLILNNTIMRPFFTEHEGVVILDDYMLYNAIGMVAIVAMSRVVFSKIDSLRVVGGAVSASAIFFIITNIGSWLSLPIYSKDITGLTTAISAGIPFFNTSWISTLLFSILLFGSFEFYQRHSHSLALEIAKK